MLSVDVVVCTHDHNRLPVITQCLDAIIAELRPSDRLIVVVDHNESLLRTLRGRYTSTGTATVGVVSNSGAPGLSAARNTGMSAGQNNIICFIDDDAFAQPGWRATLDSAFADPHVTAIGGRIDPEFVNEHGHPRPAPAGIPIVHGWVYGCDYTGIAADHAPIRNPIGAAMALRRTAVAHVGGFSTHFGRTHSSASNAAGAEETDFFLRLSEALPHARIIRFTDFAVRHRVPVGRTTWRYFVRRAFQEGRSKSLLASAGHGSTANETSHLTGAIPAQFCADLRALVRRPRAALHSMWLNASVVVASGVGFLTGRSGVPAAASGSGPLVSVILCTDGRSPHLAGALTAIFLSDADLEIILVDNSDAGDIEIRPELQKVLASDSRLRVVRAPVPGLSRARNVGVGAARGEFIAFTDDDAVVDRHWVSELLAGFDRPEVYCVTGRTIAFDLSKEVYRLFEELVSFDQGAVGKRWRLGMPDAPPLYPLPAGGFGAGNNMAFRAKAFAEIGGFAEELGAGRATRGGEDLDMFRRVVLAGHELVYRPEAAVVHRHRETYRDLRKQFYAYGLGMTASLTRAVFDDPAVVWRILRGLPEALSYFVNIRSGRAVHSAGHDQNPQAQSLRSRGLRMHLIAFEVLGLMAGPIVFIATRVKDAFDALGFHHKKLKDYKDA